MTLFPAELPTIDIPKITKEMVHTYGIVADDLNPIHFDEQVAKRFGYNDCIAHGMLVCGMSTKLISPWLNAHHLVKNFETTFLNPLMVGDSLTITGQFQKNNRTDAIIDIVAKNQNMIEILRGTIWIEGR